MIHFYGIEWAVFGAQSTVHANINVNIEFRRSRHRSPGDRVVGTFYPDTLGWAYFSANTARGTPVGSLTSWFLVIDKEWDKSELFGQDHFFFGILNGKYPGRLAAHLVG
jgi:hypothetical protein